MEINGLTTDCYKNWDEFCFSNNEAWFWHTTDWLGYILNFKPENKAENFSFFVSEKKKIKAIVPLVCETNEFKGSDIREFFYQGGPIPAPVFGGQLSGSERESLEKLVFEKIDQLACQNKIARARFWISPLSPGFMKIPPSFNYLMQFGYIDTSLNTLLIDLNKNEENLWQDLRRNHRRNILKSREFKIIIYTHQNIEDEIFYNYKDMHQKAAGRKTRSDRTFELMLEWLKNGLAFLAVIELKGKRIGFEYYLAYKNNVYGASAANDPDYAHLAIRHILEWEVILWMKKQGFAFYEIGLQQYGPLPYDFPSEKQINISHFKKGFGGFVVPLFTGEKYYNKKYQLEVWQSRLDKFLDKFNDYKRDLKEGV